MVRYYNKGGFTWGGNNFVPPSYPQHQITWWGIYNEYNINFAAGIGAVIQTGMRRYSFASTTTVYLVCSAVFAVALR